jgi:hypothetical protein
MWEMLWEMQESNLVMMGSSWGRLENNLGKMGSRRER